jgi:hypothetical protein
MLTSRLAGTIEKAGIHDSRNLKVNNNLIALCGALKGLKNVLKAKSCQGTAGGSGTGM